MKKLITVLLTLSMLFTMLVGCAQKEEVDGQNPKEDTKETSQITDTMDTTMEEKSEQHIYTDAADREIVLDAAPQRIVATYLPLWETLLMLDVMPVGAGLAEHYKQTWSPFEGVDLSQVTDIGSGNEMNLELLMELKPDIILKQVRDVSNVDVLNLEKVAPVAVLGPKTLLDWRLSLLEVGKLVGKEEKAKQVIKEVEEDILSAREELKESYEDKTVMLMSMMDVDKFYCSYRPDFYDDTIGLGLNVPEGFPEANRHTSVSMEALVEMNPDYLFVNVFKGKEAIFEEVSKNSVWQSLKAVKNGNVFIIDGPGHAGSPMATVYTIERMLEVLNRQ